METTDQWTQHEGKNRQQEFWPSVLKIGAIFALIGFVINIMFGYLQIASEPTGTLFSPLMTGGVVVCLATCAGGLVAVWHMSKHVTPFLKLGNGALIGFMTGAVIVVISTLLNEFWHTIDPDYTERLLESIVENVEAMDLPADTRDDMIDQMAAGVRDTSIVSQLFYGIPVTGLLNLLTGMLGVRFFAKKTEQTD
jgi:hypothetical protein